MEIPQATIEAVAKQLAMGSAPTDVARLHAITPNNMVRLLEDPSLLSKVAEFRQLFSVRQQGVLAEFLEMSHHAVSNVREVITDPNADKKLKVEQSWRVLEHFLPAKRSIVEHTGEVGVHANLDIIGKLETTLTKLTELKTVEANASDIEDSPYLIEPPNTARANGGGR